MWTYTQRHIRSHIHSFLFHIFSIIQSIIIITIFFYFQLLNWTFSLNDRKVMDIFPKLCFTKFLFFCFVVVVLFWIHMSKTWIDSHAFLLACATFLENWRKKLQSIWMLPGGFTFSFEMEVQSSAQQRTDSICRPQQKCLRLDFFPFRSNISFQSLFWYACIGFRRLNFPPA